MIGSKIGSYEIVEVIGQGGMATVYLAYQPTVDRYVAVKVLHQSLAENQEAMRRFQREARLIARLEHSHVLPVYDFDAFHDPPYLVMRYLEGCDLRGLLGQGRLSLAEVGFALDQIVTALGYAHQQGVVHRDIKPSNILLNLEGHLFLTDFGIARLIGQESALTQIGDVIGTPNYISPEQILGQREIDHRADIYALGAILFEMVTGKVPYHNVDTPWGIALAHVNEPVPAATALDSKLPAAIDEVIARAMAKDPADRYQNVFDLMHATNEALGPPPSEASLKLRTAIQETVNRLAQEHEKRQHERQAILSSVATQPEVEPATALQPTPPEPIKHPRQSQRNRRAMLFLGLVILIALGAAAVVIFNLSSSPASGGQEQALAAAQTATFESYGTATQAWLNAEASTGTPTPTPTITPTPSATLSPLDTSLPPPINTLEPASTNTSGPTPMPAPTETPSSPTPSSSPVPTAIPLPPPDEMVRIEAGRYQVGSPTSDEFHIPPQEITIAELWIDQYEVTNVRYKAFLDETGSPPPTNWPGQDNHPVKGVTWDQAAAYCAWANKHLPTEAEWEIAARGPEPEPPLYPWGPDRGAGGQVTDLPLIETYAVGTMLFNKSPFDVYDMAGNVWEWVGEPYAPVPNGQRVLRGGRHGLLKDMAYREQVDPDDERFVRFAGFRCAADRVQGE